MLTKELTILVIDDDPDLRNLLERYLTLGGYRVVLAESGQQALTLVEYLQPDLILLDVMMPGMDGYETSARLQAHPQTAYVPIVFVTGLDDVQDRARAFAAGAADYLTKPCRREALLDTVQRLLETRRRWYQVRISTELWDERPLPEKYIEFRNALCRRLRVSPDVARAVEQVPSSDVHSLAEYLELTQDELTEEMARFFGLELLHEIDPRALQLDVLPPAFSRTHHVVAIRTKDGGNALVISNPFNWGLKELDVLNRAFRGESYQLRLTSDRIITRLFFDEAARIELPGPESTATPEPEEVPLEKLPVMGETLSAIEVVQSIIADAVRKGASDIHLEPERDRLRIRFRIDGHLRMMVPLQLSMLPRIMGRIKILCGMDLAENRRPQDGGCQVRVDDREIELRASVLAGSRGEIAVLRILNESRSVSSLTELGMTPAVLSELRRLLSAKQGMLLITGPTGSGKTTTLYSALAYLNREDVNILTVEDPVEMDLPGVNQVQVHERAGRSFASTLRAMLRQDPDIIMVGEIRDLETAEIASRAALTGHLVLSTLHTQNAVGTLTRLVDMRVPPYLLASALNGVIAQRLVRRVCPDCAAPYTPPEPLRRAVEARLHSKIQPQFRKGQGCARCHRVGMRGRVGVYELLHIDEEMRRVVANGAEPSIVQQHIRAQGFQTLEEDACVKAAQGLIPPEEILSLGMSLAAQIAPEHPLSPLG